MIALKLGQELLGVRVVHGLKQLEPVFLIRRSTGLVSVWR